MSPIFIGPQSSYQAPYRGQLGGPIFAAPLQNGDQGVAQTIGKMRELIDQALRDPQIVRLATDIVRSAPAHDEMAEANAIYEWVLSNFRFTKDPINKEKLYPPGEMLKIRAGDCDDFSMLIATLLMAVGINARVVTVSVPGPDPNQFSHVYPAAQIDGQWIPLDAARPEAMFGSEPPQYVRKRAWSLTDGSFQDLSGLRGGTSHQSPVTSHTLGAYPRFRSLGAYQRVRTMGQADPTSAFIATIPQDISAISSAIQGRPVNPYGSFNTIYSPGAGVPAAGYPKPASSGPSPLMLLALGVGAFFLLGGR